ncbi:MAG: hypothetical protein GX579_04335 [Chloroflexi bacterium]|nr:hypothetical protein [Chloroflexota bacterium]
MEKLISRFWAPVVLVALTALFSLVGDLDARQAGDTVTLTVRLRAADGKSVAGEPVVLQRLPDEEEIGPACRTNAAGLCAWQVTRGLYQVLFERPLDGVSALALAEGGLRGFGLTVGGEDIAYHFTLLGDGRVYFDAAPEAALPVPLIPTPELLLGGVAPTASPEPGATQVTGPVPRPEGNEPGSTAGAPRNTEAPASQAPWRFILYLALGLTAGGGLHLVSRRRQRPAAGKEGKDA